jgi:hypothetical protein
MTVTATKIDSSHESGKNFVTWAWPASNTSIYNVYLRVTVTTIIVVFNDIRAVSVIFNMWVHIVHTNS